MPNYLGDKEFSYLNTNFYYNSLNTRYNDCQDEEFYNAAKEKIKKYTWNADASEQILKGLCYVYRKSLKNDFESNICNYLYYWLGNILLEKMKHNFLFQEAIYDLFDILLNDKKKICTAPPYYINVENFENIKFFFDYSEDYNGYNEQIKTHNPPCNEKYNNYLKSYVHSYNKFKAICQNGRSSYSYCNVFNEYFANKDSTNLSKWTCRLEHREPEIIEENDETETTNEQPSSTHGMEGHSVTLSRTFEGERGQGAQHLSSSGYFSDADASVMTSVSGSSDSSSPSTITKSVASAASAAGLLVPPFLVYNFTPAGAWINKLFGRNQMNRSSLTEGQLIENFYQPVDFNSERSRYNISYRPG
ncbi:Plasmodium vivax Vir protein, putative [Plasmodium vivax]|uniref:Vir protein, putative n=1 Tax=Plasmodium vivax TaxID=5855 RepID=A0A1G4E649_PLAVI|nr:Plasmodium vivax Vir protein, putative [Plasmodium vivax]